MDVVSKIVSSNNNEDLLKLLNRIDSKVIIENLSKCSSTEKEKALNILKNVMDKNYYELIILALDSVK